MNLFDPLRPKLPNSRPTWLRNHIAIPHLELFPLEDGTLEISIWLPIRDQTFASMRFTKILTKEEFLNFLTSFQLDPEKICEELFSHPEPSLNPELRNHIRFEPNHDDTPKTPTSHVARNSTRNSTTRNPNSKKSKIEISNLDF